MADSTSNAKDNYQQVIIDGNEDGLTRENPADCSSLASPFNGRLYIVLVFLCSFLLSS